MPPASTLSRSPSNTHRMGHGEFTCIPLSLFRIQRSVAVNLYCQLDDQSTPVLYRSSSIPITDDDIVDLRNRGHRALYVSSADFIAFGNALAESLHDAIEDESITPEERFSFLQSAAAVEMNAAFNIIKCDRAVSLAQGMAKQIVKLLEGNTIVPRKLFAMVQHDFYTFTHVTNVAGFANLLADKLGFTDLAIKEQITAGALLHDIGKRFIPSSLLCKKGALSDKEWELIKSHPQRGYEDLCERDDLNDGQLMMVYSHHEWLNGTGYPVGMVGNEIHPWARLLAVVDVFDAITSARPYRTPLKLSEGLEYLQRQASTHFEPEMVRCWVSAMQQG
jgi:HD-GYP domain-containing protein (c-di-GMP phosphodiesterase class II)